MNVPVMVTRSAMPTSRLPRMVVPKVGLEPTRGCPQRCLRPPRMPFRHFGRVVPRTIVAPATEASAGSSARSSLTTASGWHACSRRARSGPSDVRWPSQLARSATVVRPAEPKRRGGPRPEPASCPGRLPRDARLAAPRLRQHRRPEGPPDRGGPSLDDGPRRPRPAPRPHPHRARPCRRPRRLQRPGPPVPGLAVRARRAHGPGPRSGVRRRPGGVLLGLPEPGLVPGRQRQVVAQPDLRQRGDGHPARAQAPARRSPTRSSRTRAGSRRPARRPTPSGSPSTPSAAGCSARR